MTISTHSLRRSRTSLFMSLAVAVMISAMGTPAQAFAGAPASEKSAGLWAPIEPSGPI